MSLIVGEVKLRVFEFEWKIKVDSEFSTLAGDGLHSDLFTTNCGEEIEWYLILRPLETSEDDNDYLSIHLNTAMDDPVDENKLKVSFSILNKSDLKVNEMILDEIWAHTEVKKIDQFVKKSFLLDPRNNLIKDNQITIVCKIFFVNNVSNCDGENFIRLNEFDDFERLLLEQKFSDLTVVSADKRKFHVHKGILATRSPVFETMLVRDGIEKDESIVNVDDINYDVLLEVMRFIYSGKVNDMEKILFELLAAAEKFNIEGLKLMCEETMAEKLDEKNAIEYLIKAEKNNAEFLKMKVLKFIAVNLQSVVKTPEFKSLGISHHDLMYEVVMAIADEKMSQKF